MGNRLAFSVATNDLPALKDIPNSHLVHFVPLGIKAFLNCLALKQLVADLQDTIGVRLAFDQPSQKCILPF